MKVSEVIQIISKQGLRSLLGLLVILKILLFSIIIFKCFFQTVNVPVCFDGNLHMYCKNQPSTHMINFAAEPFQHLHYTYNTQAYYKLAL